MTYLYDTHAHINSEGLYEDREAVIKRASQNQVKRINVAGYDFPSSLRAVDMAKEFPNVYALIGIHPHDADQWTSANIKVFKELLDNKEANKIVGIGEIGLDLHFDERHSDELQFKVFTEQMRLAKDYDLPASIHSRDALDLTYKALKYLQDNNYLRENPGVMHSYDYNPEFAKTLLDEFKFYFGFAGPLTFKNGEDKREVFTALDLDRVVLETDCPYMAPEPYRGRRNEPALVLEIAKKAAELKQISLEKLAQITSNNAEKIFL